MFCHLFVILNSKGIHFDLRFIQLKNLIFQNYFKTVTEPDACLTTPSFIIKLTI